MRRAWSWRVAALAVAGFWMGAVQAAELKVTPDRSRVQEDESISVRFSVELEGTNLFGDADPEFDAPDFEEVNTYQSTSMNMVYQNGSFEAKNTVQITKVLRPLKAGRLRISNIRLNSGGNVLKHPDLEIQVDPVGQGTPQNQGGNAAGRPVGGAGGLRGAVRTGTAEPLFIRAELNKPEVYKGEQLVVGYYLYRRVRVFNIQVIKFPILKGFLREDLDLPVVRGRLEWEPIVSGGQAYQRALLAQYAAYPLQEGDLKIDQMTVKTNYYPDRSEAPGGGDDEDDLFSQFFQQLTPRTKDAESPFVSVKVKPLPVAGKPGDFKGAVGDFNVVAAVDRYQVRANEPVTLTVKVEGKGNVGAFGDPPAVWPPGVDLYESKGRASQASGGYGQKIYEFLLIPREPGKVQLPPLRFSFFNPDRGEYVTKSTQAVDLEVGPGAPGSAPPPPRPGLAAGGLRPGAQAPEVDPGEDVRYLMPPSPAGAAVGGLRIWQWLYWAGMAAFAALALWVLSDQAKARRIANGSEKGRQTTRRRDALWGELETLASQVGGSTAWDQVVRFYDRLSDALLSSLSEKYGIPARSLARSDMGRILVEERQMDARVWERAEKLLEFSELVRFGQSAGAATPETARQKASGWAREGRGIAQALDSF